MTPRTAAWNAGLRRELDDEFEFHIQRRVEALKAEGMAAECAEVEARRRFGDRDRWRDECLRVHENDRLRGVLLDVAAGGRFVAGCALVITGLLLAYTTLVRAPATFPVGGEWVLVGQAAGGAHPFEFTTTLDHYDRVAGRTDLFDRVTAARYMRSVLRLGGRAHAVTVKEVTPRYFETHGVRPVRGVLDVTGREHTVVLSHALWISRFKGDPGVIGTRIDLDGRLHDVVGIAPPEFQMYTPTDLFRTIPHSSVDARADAHFLVGAHLRTSVTFAEAAHALRMVPASSPGRMSEPRSVTGIYAGPVASRVRLVMFLFVVAGLVVAASPRALRVVRTVPLAALAAGMTGVVAYSMLHSLNLLLIGPQARLFNYGFQIEVWAPLMAGVTAMALLIARARFMVHATYRRRQHARING